MALKIPPLLQFIICILLIWMASKALPVIAIDMQIKHSMAGTLGGISLAIASAGIISFRMAGTTVDPRYPHKASKLVTDGIYRLTRNPMYLAMAVMLAGYCIYLGSLFGLFIIGGFIRYMTIFQIMPEEKALEKQFGQAFLDYKARVRRWI